MSTSRTDDDTISPACRVGDHAVCRQGPVTFPCACLCHEEDATRISSIAWRAGNHILVTHTDGEVELRPGSRDLAEELAQSLGLVPGRSRAGREEWTREP